MFKLMTSCIWATIWMIFSSNQMSIISIKLISHIQQSQWYLKLTYGLAQCLCYLHITIKIQSVHWLQMRFHHVSWWQLLSGWSRKWKWWKVHLKVAGYLQWGKYKGSGKFIFNWKHVFAFNIVYLAEYRSLYVFKKKR